MSASTERLAEKIRLLEQAIKNAEEQGVDASPLREDLQHSQQKFEASIKALHGKELLKG